MIINPDMSLNENLKSILARRRLCVASIIIFHEWITDINILLIVTYSYSSFLSQLFFLLNTSFISLFTFYLNTRVNGLQISYAPKNWHNEVYMIYEHNFLSRFYYMIDKRLQKRIRFQMKQSSKWLADHVCT